MFYFLESTAKQEDMDKAEVKHDLKEKRWYSDDGMISVAKSDSVFRIAADEKCCRMQHEKPWFSRTRVRSTDDSGRRNSMRIPKS